MPKVDVKPLSVNKCWQGRRFKTNDYKDYQEYLLYILGRVIIPDGELTLTIYWGFSNYGASDTDNPTKPFVDILQKKYGFNDSRIKRMVLEKDKVKKGEEYIIFEFKTYDVGDRKELQQVWDGVQK